MKNNTVIESKLQSTKKVFQSTHFHIDEIVVSKEGKEFTKDLITWKPIVYVIPYTEKGEVYLEMQWRDALQRIGLEVVAGHIEASEDLLIAAKRELEEETGLIAKRWTQLTTFDLSMNIRAKLTVFAATELEEGENNLDDDESIALVKMPLAEAIEKVEKGEITGAGHVAALLLFDKMKREGKL